MKYQPITCVWEVTMGCNMRCGHCGSSCAKPLPDELMTEEALDVCGQIADMGLRWVTLSGGEPLTRKDIHLLIRTLSQKGVSVNMITNGWLLGPAEVQKLKDSGISTIAISIDGTREIHNKIRKEGAFEHAERAFAAMRESNVMSGAVTTITNQNLNILSELKEELIRMGVMSWQLQLGLPMGNLKEKPDWVIEPGSVKKIIDFCYDTAKEGHIKVYPADCIGYYTKKESIIKSISFQTDNVSLWDGCNAGVRGFGILQNGDILGCTSIRSGKYIEGNLRERSLREIWEDENAFQWRRSMTKAKLSGDCRSCTYGSKCLGGCPNTRLTMDGDMYSENKYCAYNLQLKKMRDKYEKCEDKEELFAIGTSLVCHEAFQEAVCAFDRLLELEPDHGKALTAKGYAEYMCGNYEECKEYNQKAMALNPENADAIGGYAMALFKLGSRDKARKQMERAAKLSNRREEMLEDLRLMSVDGGV